MIAAGPPLAGPDDPAVVARHWIAASAISGPPCQLDLAWTCLSLAERQRVAFCTHSVVL